VGKVRSGGIGDLSGSECPDEGAESRILSAVVSSSSAGVGRIFVLALRRLNSEPSVKQLMPWLRCVHTDNPAEMLFGRGCGFEASDVEGGEVDYPHARSMWMVVKVAATRLEAVNSSQHCCQHLPLKQLGSSALPNSNPEWMQHWSETLRYSSQSGRFAEYGTSSSAALEAAGASGGASSVSALTGAGATSSNADSAGHLEGGERKGRRNCSTLDDLSQRVETVKEENLKLSSENRILGQYIENLMAASSVFAAATADGDANSKNWL
uniref:BZIP domain-containing protein n=1 Tax=Macrostomum lignano TaxID=282301 RepID=A0A1I8JQ05_9PLAT